MLLDKIFSQNNTPRVLYPLLFVVGVFIWQWMTGVNLRDEGYLWYGTKAMHTGDVTFRDNSGYDPGRYLLSGIGYWFVAVLLGGWTTFFSAVSVCIRTKQACTLLLANGTRVIIYTQLALLALIQHV